MKNHHGVVVSGSALTPSHENGSSWLATLRRTERMNAKAAKVAKGAAVAAGDGRLNGSRLSRLHAVDSFATLAAFAFIVVGAIAA